MVSSSLEAIILDQQITNLRQEFELVSDDLLVGATEIADACESTQAPDASENERAKLPSHRDLVDGIARFKAQLQQAMREPNFRCSEDIATPRRPEAPKNQQNGLSINDEVSK